MTKFNYKITGSILVKFDNKNHRIQLVKASDFGGPENEYRVLLNRKFLKGFYTEQGLSSLVNGIISNNSLAAPLFQKGDRVKIYKSTARIVHDRSFITQDPIETKSGEFLYRVGGVDGWVQESLLEIVK